MSATDKLRDQITIALKTLSWLNTNGFKPLNQQAGNFSKPVILIEASSKCVHIQRRYGAEVIGRGKNEAGAFKHWQANVDGCHVEWMEVV